MEFPNKTRKKSKKFMYIARDKDGKLYLYNLKPERLNDHWVEADVISVNNMHVQLNNSPMFDDITWEDEPRNVFISKACEDDQMLNDAIAYYESKSNPSNEEIMLLSWLRELRVLRDK